MALNFVTLIIPDVNRVDVKRGYEENISLKKAAAHHTWYIFEILVSIKGRDVDADHRNKLGNI